MLHISIQWKIFKKAIISKLIKEIYILLELNTLANLYSIVNIKKRKNYIIYMNKYWRVVRFSLWQYEEMYKYRISLYYKLTRDL